MPSTHLPHLLYVYPWMPYPRRVTIFLRERRIPQSLVTVVAVSDPQKGDSVISPDKHHYPPRPKGSLPILAIPKLTSNINAANSPSDPNQYDYLSQSASIMSYLEYMCEAHTSSGFPKPLWPMRSGSSANPSAALSQAKELGYMHLADQAMACWNPVRLFGTGAGPFSAPRAAKEALIWEKRELSALEAYLKSEGEENLVARLSTNGSQSNSDNKKGSESGYGDSKGPTFGDIMLFSFLELADDMYGKDMTESTALKVKDAYGRDTVENYPTLSRFYRIFKSRECAMRQVEEGEAIAPQIRKAGTTWAEGVFE